jgi:hypothetical protein
MYGECMAFDDKMINEGGEVNGMKIGRDIQNKHYKSCFIHVETKNNSNCRHLRLSRGYGW